MRIAIDASSAAIPQKTGVAKYIQRLIENVEQLDDRNEYVVCYRLSRWKRREYFYKPRKATTKIRLFQEPFGPGGKINIFHGPDARLPWLRRGPKLVATIHDLFALVSDEFADEGFRRRKIAQYGDIARRADKIICVSESTRSDFLRFFPEAESRTFVVYEGVDERFYPRRNEEVEKVKKKYGIESDYILYVGALSKRKNVLRMFDAFRLARRQIGRNLQFVAAGKLTYGKEEIMRSVQCDQNGGGIILTGYVPDEDLPALYSGALLFLFTTLYEGFGLPILEALACGSPVLTSNISSMREIASEATWRVNPLSHEKIAEKMIDLINGKNDPKLKLRQPLPDWKEMARQTLSLYSSL